MRLCDGCGIKVPRFQPRTNQNGQMLCNGCAEGKPGAPGRPIGLHGSVTPREDPADRIFAQLRQTLAHDSGDGATIYHCPFCGGGQVVAGSDGSVECGYCHTLFTVQVQPEHAAMPQTINGVPQDMPGMPGEVGGAPEGGAGSVPGASPATDTGTDAFVPPDAFAPPPAAAGAAGAPPAPPVKAAKVGSVFTLEDLRGVREVDPLTLKAGDRVFVPSMGSVRFTGPNGEVTFVGGVQVEGIVWTIESTQRTLSGADEITATNEQGLTDTFTVPPRAKLIKMAKMPSPAFYLNANGVALDEDAFVRHLAIAYADDPAGVIEQVRQERTNA